MDIIVPTWVLIGVMYLENSPELNLKSLNMERKEGKVAHSLAIPRFCCLILLIHSLYPGSACHKVLK